MVFKASAEGEKISPSVFAMQKWVGFFSL